MAEEKTFKHYEEFPPEIRMEVINEMRPTERVRFTRCSKLSQNEAKKTKNYTYELQIQFPRHFEKIIVIRVAYKKHELDVQEGYDMVFKKEGRQKYMRYQLRHARRELYRVKLNESVDLVEYAKEHFKKLLQQYQNTIKHLLISETNNFDYGIRNLKNLESLSLGENSDVLPFLSKIRRPFKDLYFQDTANHEIITASDQIYQVQLRFQANLLKINYEQFKRLNAEVIYVSARGLTPHDLYDFIKSWKTGTIRNNFRECWWYLADSDFEKNELYQLLGVESEEYFEQRFEIKHDTVAGRTARLDYTLSRYLIFTVLEI